MSFQWNIVRHQQIAISINPHKGKTRLFVYFSSFPLLRDLKCCVIFLHLSQTSLHPPGPPKSNSHNSGKFPYLCGNRRVGNFSVVVLPPIFAGSRRPGGVKRNFFIHHFREIDVVHLAFFQRAIGSSRDCQCYPARKIQDESP